MGALEVIALGLAFLVGRYSKDLMRQLARSRELNVPAWGGVTQYTSPDAPLALISSARVCRIGVHDHVQLWNRGGLSGVLVMSAGDGAELAARLRLGADPTWKCKVCGQPSVTAFGNDEFCAKHADEDPRGIAERERIGEG